MRTSSLVGAALVSLAVGCLGGCYTIGGALRPLPPPATAEVGPDYRLETISSGQDVEIVLKDGRHVEGTFREIARVPASLYGLRYNDFAAANDGWLPAPGRRVAVTRSRMTFGEFRDAAKSGSPFGREHYQFRGFDYGSLVVAPVEQQTTLEPTDDIRLALLEVGDVTSLSGQRVTGQDLRHTFETEKVPLLSSIVVDTAAGRSEFPLEEVRRILVTIDGQQRQLNVLLGAAADVGQFLSAFEDFGPFF